MPVWNGDGARFPLLVRAVIPRPCPPVFGVVLIFIAIGIRASAEAGWLPATSVVYTPVWAISRPDFTAALKAA